MFAFVLATALAAAPTPQPAMDCVQNSACTTMAQMNTAECSMASMPATAGHPAKPQFQAQTNNLYNGRK
jgi:hypothetical protein